MCVRNVDECYRTSLLFTGQKQVIYSDTSLHDHTWSGRLSEDGLEETDVSTDPPCVPVFFPDPPFLTTVPSLLPPLCLSTQQS